MYSVLLWMASKVTLFSFSCHSLSDRRAGRRNCPHVSRRIGLWLSEPERESGAAGPREQSHSTVPGGAEEELHDLTHGQSTHCEHNQLQRLIADPQTHSTNLEIEKTRVCLLILVFYKQLWCLLMVTEDIVQQKITICLPSKNEFFLHGNRFGEMLENLLNNGSSAVNGCRQNESPNSW